MNSESHTRIAVQYSSIFSNMKVHLMFRILYFNSRLLKLDLLTFDWIIELKGEGACFPLISVEQIE